MIKTERMDAILHILYEKKYATVNYLAEHIYVSKVTMRRELQKMEDLGLVVRSHGGVALNESENRFVPLAIRELNSPSIKDQIARQAVRLISEGSTLFMDGSSTVMRMVNYMKEKQDITVITNSLRTALLLCEKKIKVYCTGGLLLPEASVCIGPHSENLINSVTADYAFFSSQGLSANGIISDFSENETHQRVLMLQHSRKKYFLCDSSKLGKCFLFTVCHISDIDGVICDTDHNEWLRNEEFKVSQDA